jgi:hypothetical protein
VLRDGARDFHDRGFLESVGANHAARDLASDGDDWDTIEQRVSESTDEVGGAGSGSGDADARET